VDAALRDMVAGGPAGLRFETNEVVEDGSLVIDIGRIVSETGQWTETGYGRGRRPADRHCWRRRR
jgi:hypothetical protein